MAKNDNVLIALFPSEEAANLAVHDLMVWDDVHKDVKLGAVGTIVKEGDKVKTHVGRQAGKGVAIGAVLGLISAVLSGGLTIVGGAVAGGVVGAFFKKSTHLTRDHIETLGKSLEGGRAAVVVTCDEDEVEPTSAKLADLGGSVQDHEVPSEALEEAAKGLEEAGAEAG